MPDWSAMSRRDVALDADLALHERAHGGLGVAVDEQRLGGRPVDLDPQVGGRRGGRARRRARRGTCRRGRARRSAENGTSVTTRLARSSTGAVAPSAAYSSRSAWTAASHSSLRNSYVSVDPSLGTGEG